MIVHSWRPNIKKGNTYVLRIPDGTYKHRETKALLDGRKAIVLEKVREYRGHGVYKIQLLSVAGYPDKLKKQFDMWGPYLCCACPTIVNGCRCGGY